MRWSTVIKFAWKNLWAHRLRAVLTVGGVAIGVAAIVFLVSIGFGLEQLVTKQVADFDAFTIIDVPSTNLKTGKINQEAISKISQIPHVLSIDKVVDVAGRMKLKNQDSTTETVIVGIEPNYFKLAGIVPSNGILFGAKNTNGVVINKVLAGLLGDIEDPTKVLNQEIESVLIIPRDLRAQDIIEGPIEKETKKLKVIGIVDDNQAPMAFFPLSTLYDAGVVNNTSLKVRIDNKDNADIVRKGIENAGFSTEYVGDTVQQIAQIFSLFRAALLGFGSIALVIAALGAFNILTISLMERIREIGLLKTLGMKRKTVFKLFISESMTIGILGGLIGICAGHFIGFLLNEFLRNLAIQAGADPVSIFYLPMSFSIIIAIGSFVIGFVTGFYPAFRAIKTSALDALRYE